MGDFSLFVWPLATGAIAALFAWMRYRSIMTRYKADRARAAARHIMAE